MLFGWVARTNADDGPDWRIRDLLFLKAAHDRLQIELTQHSGGSAEASLRRGQQALLQAMAATAKPMSADSIPQDVRPLLMSIKTPQAEELAALFDAVATERSAELRSGLDLTRLSRLDLAGLAVGSDLRGPLDRAKARRKPPADKPAELKRAGQ